MDHQYLKLTKKAINFTGRAMIVQQLNPVRSSASIEENKVMLGVIRDKTRRAQLQTLQTLTQVIHYLIVLE